MRTVPQVSSFLLNIPKNQLYNRNIRKIIFNKWPYATKNKVLALFIRMDIPKIAQLFLIKHSIYDIIKLFTTYHVLYIRKQLRTPIRNRMHG